MQGYQVKLPVFEGPFDLLFHLIEEQKINIYDIPIAAITAQYLDYLQMMEILDMEVASSFLVMAATLLEIKSKMLLPREPPPSGEFIAEEGEDGLPVEGDARADLVEKLLEYKRFKLLALQLRELERQNSRLYARGLTGEFHPEEILQIQVSPLDLLNFYQSLVRRRLHPPVHRVILDRLSVEEKIAEIRRLLAERRAAIPFRDLVKNPASRADTVLSFLAILEMTKAGEITLKQAGNFKPVTICLRTANEPAAADAGSETSTEEGLP
ncbi:MAG: Segregation and condensation protein A [Candidatus Ozemobacter sibiricus]|uniref:Segregation and condensation protein A n=1 Tax=Candidatus Ozemobacter sibiricus TaxID=2268124 RepID=A0A367ZN16_9BACT|nr:MAG: Segregation and condensation protein A [Candidatus Ozemobacter sibiricus]